MKIFDRSIHFEMISFLVYDDYKFLTLKELETLGLSHLIGTDLLRAYMHGYFMDIRLYNQAKSVAEPFAFAEYRKKKLREKIDEKRDKSRVPLPVSVEHLFLHFQ